MRIVSIFLVLTLQSCAVMLGSKEKYVYYFSPSHYAEEGILGYVQVPTGKIYPYTHAKNIKQDDWWYSRAFRDAYCVGYGTQLSFNVITPADVIWPVPNKLNKINH